MNQKYLYLSVNLLSISVPLIASFYPRAPFFKQWKHLWPAIVIPAAGFIIWDEFFTQAGIWGFNERYVTGIYIGSLPLEELLFFICIPYACVFTYFALAYLMEKDVLWPYQELISSVLILGLLIAGIYFIDRAYTSTTFILLSVFIAYEMLKRRARYISRFYIAFAAILIPFTIVNGILTGSFIEEQVVWYNDKENLGIRLGTIPVEDVFYGMLLLMLNVSIFESLRQKHESKVRKRVRA